GSLHILHDESFWMNYRQLGLMERILCDMGELCPDAWLIMVSNPVMAGITYLGRKYPRAKVVGMCHGFHNVYGLADKLGLERDKISFEIPGVNHFVWLNRFFYEGKDAFPLLDRWIKNESKGYFATCKKSDNTGPKAIDLYRRFGVFPIGDTGNPGGGSWGWEYHTDEKTQALWNEDPDFWYDDYFRRSGEQAKKLKDTADNMDVRVTDVYSRSLSPEPMVPLLEALACDISRVVVVNTMNTGGFVEGVPLDFEVEIPAVISAKGVQGLHTKPLPKAVVSHMQRDRIAPVNIELAAYENRSRSLLLELILLDPWTRTRAQAEGFLEEILAMPGNEDMAEHYR
ncbi:MAG: hypothetical protein RSB78_05040, partial [Oscillospiraceae bacterium]